MTLSTLTLSSQLQKACWSLDFALARAIACPAYRTLCGTRVEAEEELLTLVR